jgi:dTDP-4-amino-4,6-dideoxygalactose transaminase
MINVNKPFLPPLQDYTTYLNEIWSRQWLTNNGPCLIALEGKLKNYLNTPNFLFVGNGTIALQLAIKAFELKGDIITTPFSYVATITAILWENCTPVFVDIDEQHLCINPELIEQAITPATSAILATHVYGNPCDVVAIKTIADKHNIKVIYDGAHAFGVKFNNQSLFNFGDISTLSFHATKLFHTVEGGGIAWNDTSLYDKLFLLRSFGHIGDDYYSIGINGKNSEFHAAMGLAVLPYIEEIIAKRKNITQLYNTFLNELNILKPQIRKDTDYNYAYYPVIFNSESELLKVMQALKENQVNTRRYFYPSLNALPYIQKSYPCPVSEDISKRVLCLPLYPDLALDDVRRIAELIINTLK